MTRKIVVSLLFAGACLSGCALAQTAADWQTPTEKSGYRTTPDYAETMAFINRVASAAPGQVKVEPFGTTGEGRELDIVIVSKDGAFDPVAIHASHRPILLVQNSIHAGEMDGKDSCLALLRDMVISKTQAALLDNAVFVFIPMYNADGHERRSPYNRINQNGPEVMGWRANGTNLNLNRDYLKADAPETHAFMKMFHQWLPDFFVDDHVTDGADFQYDVTFTIDDGPNVYGPTAHWIDDVVTPTLVKQVDAVPGHLASPTYITLNDDTDPAKGLGFNDDPPRFSTGYMILENRPVRGNYELLRALLEMVNRDAAKLIRLNADADADAARLGAHPLGNQQFPLRVGWGGETTPFLFRGYHFTRQLSEVSGAMWIKYSHEPWDVSLPLNTGFKVTASTVPPAAYIIPRQWTHVIDVLAAHQVEMQRTSAQWTGQVETYRCNGMQWNRAPFEGRHPIFPGEGASEPGSFGHCDLVTNTVTYPTGSAVVQLNQRLSKVALQWLEPEGPDSAMAWGFFDPIFEQKEYGEAYVLEKLARDMMAKDPKLREEFERKIDNDPKFAANPYARLSFFYDHSPWYAANRIGEYPVGRLTKLDGVSLEK
jgi:hypothetical protein